MVLQSLTSNEWKRSRKADTAVTGTVQRWFTPAHVSVAFKLYVLELVLELREGLR